MKRHWDYTPGEFFDFLYGRVKAYYSGRGGGKSELARTLGITYSEHAHARVIWMAGRMGTPFLRADLFRAMGVSCDSPTVAQLARLVEAGALECSTPVVPDKIPAGRAPRYCYTPTEKLLEYLAYYDRINPARSGLPWNPKTS